MKEIRTGTIRNERSNAEILKDQFQIDEHSFTDVLGYISAFLKEINYYNLENRKQGTWDELVNNDPIFFIATIINQPIDELQQIANYFSETGIGHHERSDLILKLLGWTKLIKHWEDQLRELQEDVLADKIQVVYSDMLHGFTQQLKKSTVEPVALYAQPNPNQGNMPLGKALLIFIKVVMLIQDAAKTHLQKHLYARSDHQPHTAMYMAFALLYKKFQGNVNQLSKKHLDFYYNQVLKEKPGQGKDSSAIVYFTLLPNVDSALVPKDLKLSAGKLFGSKSELFFYTEKPFVAYSIGIAEINTLYFNYSKVIDVGVSESLISSVTKSNVWNNGKKRTDIKDWQLFGAQPYAEWEANVNTEAVADFGFIVQSPVLLLEEGERSITIKINLAENAQDTLWKLIDEIATSKGLLKSTVIAEIFESGLKVSFSSETGWQTVSQSLVTGNEDENFIAINIKLDASVPAVATFKKNNPLTWPAVKVMLNEFAPTYLYSFLKGVDIKSIIIDVAVQEVKKLSLYNNIAKVTPGKAFELFGPTPEKGSYFLVGKPEFFIKKLNKLELHINWLSLPTDEGGFTTYYNNYSYPFKNTSFQLTPQVLQNGVWNTLEAETIPLFAEKTITDKGGYTATVIDSNTTIQVAVNELEWVNPSALNSPLVYKVDSIAGFFKFVLSAPEPGFGFNLYQKDFTAVALENAKSKTTYPYPNKPVSPKVSDLTVHYSASDELNFEESISDDVTVNRGVFQHITPFTTEDVIQNQVVSGSKLLFNYKNVAYFFMGLTNVVAETTISMYFQLFTINQVIVSTQRSIQWEYFNVNKWEPLRDSDVIIDGTNGFLKSGIIELTLPKVTTETLASQDGIYWLRISTSASAVSYPKVKGVYMNATQVYARNTPPELRGKVVPNGSIHKIVTKQPSLKGVGQPSLSKGGIAVESQEDYYLRLSEHLRHKGRAVSIWDYEHLILQRFESVFAVKCTNLNDDFKPVSGKVRVIVLSKYWTYKNRYYYNSDQLFEMKRFLLERANQFVQLQVVNPVEEYLLVNVVVKYRKEDVGGYYLDLLNTDLVSFLSPNAYVENGLLGIGGSISRSSIISFVQNLPYIADVKYMSVEHIVVKEGNRYVLNIYEDSKEIAVSSPGSMLISVEQHNIQTVTDHETVDLQPGIGEMEVGLDLILPNAPLVGVQEHDQPAIAKKTAVNDSIFVFKKAKNNEV